MSQVKSGVARASSDVVIVTGDTVCSAQIRLLSELLRKLIPGDVPIVVTHGNHEFRGRTFEETLAELKEQTIADKNIFYLDLIGAVKLGRNELCRRHTILCQLDAYSGKPASGRMGLLAGLAYWGNRNALHGVQRLLRRHDQIKHEAGHLNSALHPPCAACPFEQP